MVDLSGICEGNIFSTVSGLSFKVKKINSCYDVEIEFADTGSIVSVRAGEVRTGYIKDLNEPSVYGVGFLGYGVYSEKTHPKARRSWSGMLERCYSEKLHKKHPAYIECEVCEEWQDFQCFAEWFEQNHPTDGRVYHLDKDIMIDGNKIYSPSTCKFVSPSENTEKACALSYVFTSPEGVDVEIYNMNKFCRDNNLTAPLMNKVYKGLRNKHKGWTNGRILRRKSNNL